MSAKTIAERMKAKTADAENEIRRLLWAPDSDPDAIAAAALAGGLSPAAVEKIEAGVAEGKAAVAALGRFDLGALASKYKATTAAAAKAEAAADAAAAKFSDAMGEARCAAGALFEARTEIEAVASRVTGGQLPADNLPDVVAAVIAARDHFATFERLKHELSQLAREIKTHELRADALETEARTLKGDHSDAAVARNGRLHSLLEDYTGTAKTIREAVARGRKREKLLAAEIETAKKAHAAAAARLPWHGAEG